ncbi:MAG TPA: SIS domain-containing protein [Pseudonocardia sp.]|nr:SIS domain-containing protein [Pseudonocardia sp.]
MSTLAAEAENIASACQAMALRFARGGRLVVLGSGGSRCDAAHVVVEFVHPVIVGKRALPAFSLEGPDLADQLELLADPQDIVLVVTAGPVTEELSTALRSARRRGLLTVALSGADGWPVAPNPDAPDHAVAVASSDELVVKEAQVTCYHLLWELVHVFLGQPGGPS